MNPRGISASGLPVYSAEDPSDYLLRWLRLSWPAVLSGKYFDKTADGSGWWLCASVGLSPFTNIKISDPRGGVRGLTAECAADLLVHGEDEDSTLNPSQVFSLPRRTYTLVIEARFAYDKGAYTVLEFAVRRTTRETEPIAKRYGGGDFGFHVWKSDTSHSKDGGMSEKAIWG